jgi:cobalt-zinc-cadmium efflux system outer membrane protein
VAWPLLLLASTWLQGETVALSDGSLGGELQALKSTEPQYTPPSEYNFEELEGEITLLDVFAAVLLNNPRLAQYGWSVRISEAETLQAGLLPNPEIGIDVEEFAGSGERSGFDGAESTVLISQLIELGQKRQNRTEVARLNEDITSLEYEATRVAILADVSKAFINVLAAQERHQLIQMNLELAEQALVAADKRVEAGAASPLEQAKSKAIVTSEKINVQRSQRELDGARIRLAALWGSSNPKFTKVRGAFLAHDNLPDIHTLYTQINQHPKIARWAAKLAERRAAIRLEQSEAIPDFTVGVGLKHLNQNDDLSAVIQVSVPIPVFNRNQGNILKARRELERARQGQRETEVQVYASLTNAYQQLTMLHEELGTIKTELLVTAQGVYNDTRRAYEEGKANYLEVIDAQRMLFDARLRYNESQAAYHQIAVDIEALIGQSLSNFQQPSSETTSN